MFEQPILIYSNYCAHSKEFLGLIQNHPQIHESFNYLNIDVNPTTRKRNPLFNQIQQTLNHRIEEVPTVIINNGQYVLSGKEAFKWLEFQFKQLSSGNDTTQQSVNAIQTDNVNDNASSSPEAEAFNPNEMLSFSDQYSKYGSNDMSDASAQSFSFLNGNYDSIATPAEESKDPRSFLKSSGSKKENDIDKRLQDLISKREEFGVTKRA